MYSESIVTYGTPLKTLSLCLAKNHAGNNDGSIAGTMYIEGRKSAESKLGNVFLLYLA